MADIQNLTGKYMGRQLESETAEYKKYKMAFQVDEKTLNFKVFTPWTKKDGSIKAGLDPTKLEEGNWYKLGYNIFEGKRDNGETFKSKTLISVFDGQEPTEKQLNKQTQSSTQQQIPQSSDGITVPKDLTEFIDMYKNQVDEKVKSVNHFIGTVIRTYNEEKIKELVNVYKEKLE